MKTTIFIIPGNPSSRFYYAMWAQALAQKLKHIPDLEIKTLHHLRVKDSHQNLDEYIEDFMNYIDEEVSNTSTSYSEIILIGHSIGGFMASQYYKKHSEKITSLLLVFPFFGMPNVFGRSLLGLTSFLKRYKTVQNRALKGLLKLKRICSSLSNVTHFELHEGIKLGHLERLYFKTQPISFDESLVSDKVKFFYTYKDNWCTKKTISAAQEMNLNTYHIDSIHDFVLKNSEIKIVNDALFKI